MSEPDQIDMMSESELREELCKVILLNIKQKEALAAAQRVVEAAQELKIRWCTAGQGNTDEAMDALFDLLPESTP